MVFLYRTYHIINSASTVDIKEERCFSWMNMVWAIWALFRFRVCMCRCNEAISLEFAVPKNKFRYLSYENKYATLGSKWSNESIWSWKMTLDLAYGYHARMYLGLPWFGSAVRWVFRRNVFRTYNEERCNIALSLNTPSWVGEFGRYVTNTPVQDKAVVA